MIEGDVTIVRTEPNGYSLGVLQTADGWLVYFRVGESSTWTRCPDVSPFATEELAVSWITWQTIIPFRRP